MVDERVGIFLFIAFFSRITFFSQNHRFWKKISHGITESAIRHFSRNLVFLKKGRCGDSVTPSKREDPKFKILGKEQNIYVLGIFSKILNFGKRFRRARRPFLFITFFFQNLWFWKKNVIQNLRFRKKYLKH